MADKKRSRAKALAGERGWVGMLRLALLPGLLGLCLTPLTILDWWTERARQAHTRVDAIVETLSTHQTEEAMGRSTSRGAMPVYHATVTSRFEAAGKPYTCELKTQTYDAAHSAAFAAAHAKGARMPVWYDPADPAKNSGIAPDPSAAGTRALLSLGLAVGGFALFMVGRAPSDPA